jgi:Zn-dependent protease/CBS domain-containing protein
MFGLRWQPFRLLGIPISVDASWLIILALLTLSLGSGFPVLLAQYFPGYPVDLAPYEYWLMGLVASLAFFGCILLHEMGHAVVARSQGMPIRGITLFLFGGVAEMGDEPESAGGEFLMAIAGPVVSVILALGLGLLAWLGYHKGWPHPLVIILGYLAFINMLVLAFNLVPAFPLDGGRVLRSILWGATGNLGRATHWAALLGQAFAWLLIAWGVLQFFMGNWLGGVWIGLIGMFLNSAARGGYQQVLVRQALEGEPVRRFMNPDPIAVPPSLDLRRWVEDFVYRYHRKTFPVVSDGHLEGFIDTSALGEVSRQEWVRYTIGDVMRRDVEAITIAPDADALQALGKMRRTGSSRLLVVDGDRLVGIISLKDLLSFLHLKIELEVPNGEALAAPTWGACIGTERKTVKPDKNGRSVPGRLE